ncbi:MAG: VOC family protein [Acidimicrobiia bacterium]
MATGFQVTFDASDPQRLAEFWAEALQYVVQPPPPDYDTWEEFAVAMGIPEDEWGRLAAIVDPAEEGPRVLFQRVPETKTSKNRVHLDVNVGAGHEPEKRRTIVAAESERLGALGAVTIRTHDEGHEYWIVMRDPEGNEFCLQ